MDEHGDIQLMFHRDKCEYSKNKKDSKETILLIDAVYFSINQKDKDWWYTSDNLEVNEEMRDYIDTLPYTKIIVTNADSNVIKEVLKEKKYNDIFTLNNNPNKTDPAFFQKLQEKYNQYSLGQFLYVDHSQENINSAKQSWIQGFVCNNVEDVKNIIDHLNPQSRASTAPLPNDLTPYKLLQKYIDVWDFLWVRWELFRTHKGELTIFVSEFILLSKAIRSLWDKFHGIWENKESAYRQRYLDMIHNRETLERMKLRSTFLRVIRDFYHKHDFLEVETPVLWHSASWAAAAPFITRHNDFDIEMYLRISPETSLKMATVWGLERVFEVAKDFRNEWSSPAHHQEFTMIEHYAAYRNFEDNMRFTEEMFDYIFDAIPSLKKRVQVTDKNWITKEVDFTTPWARIDYIDQIKKDSGIDVSQYGPKDEEKLRKLIKEKWHMREWLDHQATATMIDYLYKKVTRPKIVWPAFIYNYPKTMQPLARRSDENPGIVEQRQLLTNWIELIKAYSELVDPLQQQENFDEQSWAVERWDEEATAWDDDFVKAMEYGMPCQSGRGMWIARILSILTEQSNIRDVILFPLMKPENQDKESNPQSRSSTAPFQKEPGQDNEKASFWKEVPDRAEDFSGQTVSFSDSIVSQAEKLAQKYLTDTLGHCQQVGRTMRNFADTLGQDTNYWYIVGLLHDVDWDHINKSAEQHLQQDFEKIISELNIDTKTQEQLILDIRSHYPDGTWVQPNTLIQKYLISVDELSWLIHAYSIMRPEWLDGMKRSSLNKKIKDKKFAAWVDRIHVKNCETYLGIELEKFAMQVVEMMRGQKYT